MYRSAAALLILFFSISASGVDSRVERWNQRIENLKKIQNVSKSGKFETAVINEITGSEIKSSEEFISILNRYKREDGSLKSETKKYSIPEIEKKVKEIALPAISLFYMAETYKNMNDTQIKEKSAGEISAYAAEKYSSSVKISSEDKNSIVEQYILEKAIAEFDNAVTATTNDLLSRVQYELSRSDYNSNEADFSKMIQRLIEEILSAKKFSETGGFNTRYLLAVPQWRYITEQHEDLEARNTAIINFVKGGGGSLDNSSQVKDVDTAEEIIFVKAKSRLYHLLKETTPSSGAMGNNPYYEIPDLQKLGVTIDEIDRYRKTLTKNISGSENSDLISKLKSNNTGIAARGINRIEAQFKNEDTRIERLRKIKGDVIIYNEEIFKASRTHFYSIREELFRYADLSAAFVEVLYSTGKTDPKKYIEFHKYRTDRYIQYISFFERLTANTITLSESGSVKLGSFYKGVIPGVLNSGKDLLKPVIIPTEIRESFNKEHLKELAAVNADYRIKGTLLLKTSRNNFNECIAGFSRTAASDRESSINSEMQIGQDETDRLFSFAKKCSEAIKRMNYTETALNRYKDEYTRVSEAIRKGNKPQGFSDTEAPASFLAALNSFNPDTVDKEINTRELLAKEGMESLSGSITLVQYYKRKGIPVKFTPTAEEIASMKLTFSRSPEVIISSWKMNGKNYRQIDVNITAELKKLLNKNAWNNSGREIQRESLSIDEAELTVTFTPPSGWKKNSTSDTGHSGKVSFESPDMKGVIEIMSIRENEQNLQMLAGSWPERNGFSMTEKNWGKKDNCDYIKSTAKNRYDGIMESYMISKNGHVIILSGKTTGDKYRQLNRTLAEIFSKLQVKG